MKRFSGRLTGVVFFAVLIGLFFSCIGAIPLETRESPKSVGQLVIQNLLKRSFMTGQYGLHYAEACTAYGALKFAGLTADRELLDKLVHRYEIILDPVRAKNVIPVRDHVDDYVFGIIPLEIYMQTKDERYLKLGLGFADRQWATLRPDGLPGQTRFWIDDMYMVGSLQIQACRATGDIKYARRIVDFLNAYLDKLQQPSGLFRHGEISPYYWARGNGWVAASMAEVLSTIPADLPGRTRLMQGYVKMMDALVQYQSETGMWRQIIDKDHFWFESSATAMFTFALTTGVSRGWLVGDKYGLSAKKGYQAILDYLDASGNIRAVCQGTSQSEYSQYYFERKQIVGDLHGQAPVLWTVISLLESP